MASREITDRVGTITPDTSQVISHGSYHKLREINIIGSVHRLGHGEIGDFVFLDEKVI